MIPTPYFIYARLTSAIVCSIPFFALYYFFLGPHLGPFFTNIMNVKWVGNVSTVSAFIFLLVLLGRSISKDIFERWWFESDYTRMPATEFLLHTGIEFTQQYKTTIHERIKTDFKINILSPDAEATDQPTARRVIAEAVGLIRQKIGSGRLLLQHNMEYGFFRNLVGCSVIAVLVSALNIWVFGYIEPNKGAFILSMATAIIYLMPIILSKMLMQAHGKRYARILFQEYLSL